MKCVVVTGVSTGIGRGAATVLAAKGWHVFDSVRKLADARPLQEALAEAFTPLVFDVEDNDAILAAACRRLTHPLPILISPPALIGLT